MAMTMNGQVQLPASREVVWAKLNNPEVLITCIPGGEQLEKISDSEFRAIATVKVGPVKARWKGRVQLLDLDPPNSYRISGEGDGGVAGFARGGAKVSSPTRTVGHCSVMMSRRRSGESWRSSDNASSTVPPKRLQTTSF